MKDQSPLILVTGATGYIGGRLVPRLLELGYNVRCMVRDASRLRGRFWFNKVEIITGDVLNPDSLQPAMSDVSVAYYLIHSMGSGEDFHQRDMTAATNFSNAAAEAGVEQIIYLGGLAKEDEQLSEHLQSRQQTGVALRKAGVPVTEFRAGVIVGSGSLSFEMIRYLTERVPVMICPRWVYTKAQPIGVRDVLQYLSAALTIAQCKDRIIEIGQPEVITYGEMMTIYADVRGLRRWLVPVPVLTPYLSSHWVNLVTPIPGAIARPLIEGLRNENVVTDHSAHEIFPQIKPANYKVSVERALTRLEASDIESAWSDALITSQGDVEPVVLTTHEGLVMEHRQRVVKTSRANAYKIFTGIGGKRGWLYMDWSWKIRGFIDRMIGGVGLRRGRRDPDELRVGDALDFWRVEDVQQDKLLRLRAEMKVPGKAWLQYQVQDHEKDSVLLSQTAFFAPKGLFGFMYWYALYPIHGLIFSGIINRIADLAVRGSFKD